MRRGGVDRLAATLLYADRNSRKSSLRRRSPLTKTARLASTLEACPLGIVRTGIFPAPAALRRIVDTLTHSLPMGSENGCRALPVSVAPSGGHLPPEEPGKLPGHGGGHHALDV